MIPSSLRLGNEVDLVQQKDDRLLRALHEVQREFVILAEFLRHVVDEEQQVATFERVIDLLHHPLIQECGRACGRRECRRTRFARRTPCPFSGS